MGRSCDIFPRKMENKHIFDLIIEAKTSSQDIRRRNRWWENIYKEAPQNMSLRKKTNFDLNAKRLDCIWIETNARNNWWPEWWRCLLARRSESTVWENWADREKNYKFMKISIRFGCAFDSNGCYESMKKLEEIIWSIFFHEFFQALQNKGFQINTYQFKHLNKESIEVRLIALERQFDHLSNLMTSLRNWN